MFSMNSPWYLFMSLFFVDGSASEPPPPPAHEGFSPSQRQFQREMLERHNYFRRMHCLLPLKLDDALSQSAIDYAQELVKIGKLVHSKNSENFGENLYKSTSSKPIQNVDGNKITRAWYNEVNDYDFHKPEISQKTGHFTQLVWKDSKKFGVGYALSEDGRTVFAVARYSPPGNIKSELAHNVFPPALA